MPYEQDINMILRSCAHQETQNASQDTERTLNSIKHTNGFGVDWNQFEHVQVRMLDARSHDAHVRAVHKLTQKAKSLPPDQQQSFMDKAMRAMSGFNNLLSAAFSRLTSIVVDAISSAKGLFDQVLSIISVVVDQFVSLIEDSIHHVMNWASDAAHSIEQWKLL